MSPVSFSESDLQILRDLVAPLSVPEREKFMLLLDQQLKNYVGELGEGGFSRLGSRLANAPLAGGMKLR